MRPGGPALVYARFRVHAVRYGTQCAGGLTDEFLGIDESNLHG
jgi:hypothetical protein